MMLHQSWIEDLLDEENRKLSSRSSSEMDSPSSSCSSYLGPDATLASFRSDDAASLWDLSNSATMQSSNLQRIAQLLSPSTVVDERWGSDASASAHLALSPPNSSGSSLSREDFGVPVAKPVSSWMVDKATLETYLQQYGTHLVGILDEGHKTELMRSGTSVTIFLVLHLLRHMEPQGWVSKNVAHPAKYLTTSIKNLRAALCNNALTSSLLSSIWEVRPDIATWVDGKTLHYLADHLTSDQVALECLACLSDALPLGWSHSLPNQRATVLSTIKHFFAVKYHLGSQLAPFSHLA
jgi:hypothetical protein